VCPLIQSVEKICANYVINEVSAKMNEYGINNWEYCLIPANVLRQVAQMQYDNIISHKSARIVIEQLWIQGAHYAVEASQL
jgi:Asp-tRNA(Asn)/Glu-tRNA(Gln) amidotransferase B subunit